MGLFVKLYLAKGFKGRIIQDRWFLKKSSESISLPFSGCGCDKPFSLLAKSSISIQAML